MTEEATTGQPWEDADEFFTKYLQMQQDIKINFASHPDSRMADFYRQTKPFTHEGEVFIGMAMLAGKDIVVATQELQSNQDRAFGQGKVEVRLDSKINPGTLGGRRDKQPGQWQGYLPGEKFAGVFVKRI